jgi:KaiC/GvpD/RAD55 family RecA-like ATPase
LDWGLWYDGKSVQVTNASDSSGKLAFIYPLPSSDPTRPVLRILFSTPVTAGQPYTFTYDYDVTSDQDSLSWSETFDTSQVLIRSLTITITLPPNYQPTGVQPSNATQSQTNGRTLVTWSGTDLSGLSNVGVTIGFGQSTSSPVSFSSTVSYAAVGVAVLAVGLFGLSRFQTNRKKRRIEPYAILETQAKQAASELSRPFISTGVPPLDYLLNGGLPALSASIMTAPACDERDMILRRILETGLKEGGVSVYVGKDTSKIEDFLDAPSGGFQVLVTRVQGLAGAKPQVRVTDKVDNLNGISIDLMSLLQSCPQDASSKRLCIDLLDDVLLTHKSTVTRRWLTTILGRVKALGFTVIATLNSQMHSQADAQAIVDLFEGHIQLAEKSVEEKPRIIMRVQKMFRWKVMDSEAVLDRNKI